MTQHRRFPSPPTILGVGDQFASNYDFANALSRAGAALTAADRAFQILEARVVRLETICAKVQTALPPFTASPVIAVAAIDSETRSHVDTATAASWLNRAPQTLRKWACYEDGPLRPNRLNGRLAWSVVELRTILASQRT